MAFAMAAHLVRCEPDAGMLDAYLEPGMFDASPFAGDDPRVARGLAAVSSWCDEARPDPDRAGRLAELRDDWFQLVAGPGEPKAPAWAGFYLSTNSQILGEESLTVRRMYARHGFEVARKNREPDDDLGLMLGFLGELAAEAGDPADTGSDVRAGDAARADSLELIDRHIMPWIGIWRDAMAENARTSFYRGVADYVAGLLVAWRSCLRGDGGQERCS